MRNVLINEEQIIKGRKDPSCGETMFNLSRETFLKWAQGEEADGLAS